MDEFPEFGHQRRDLWGLDPAVTYLNHGTVGATPLAVLQAQRDLRDEIERQPSRFLLRELTAVRIGRSAHPQPRLREAADRIAPFFRARGEDLVFVDNATTGVNSILRSHPLAAGDEILITDQTYGAVTNAARFVARERQASVRVAPLPDLLGGPLRPDDFVLAVEAAIGPRTRLAIVDHISSDTAVVLPVADIAAACRRRGIALIVDGAHAPGSIDLDIPRIGADWYVGNLHKWAMAPRSSAILWTSPGRQEGLHPTVISWGLDQGYTTEFDLVGTRDPSPHLAAPAGLEFLARLGFERLRAHNGALARRAGDALAAFSGVHFAVPQGMLGPMAAVPMPAAFGADRPAALALRDALLFEDSIEVHAFARGGRVWLRVACQVYNAESDIERLLAALVRRAARGSGGG